MRLSQVPAGVGAREMDGFGMFQTGDSCDSWTIGCLKFMPWVLIVVFMFAPFYDYVLMQLYIAGLF